MSKLILTVFLAIFLIACGENKKNNPRSSETKNDTMVASDHADLYPENLKQIFDHHGGIDRWNAMKSLTFEIGAGNTKESQIIDLKSRKTLIKKQGAEMGFDGSKTWIAQDSVVFNPERAQFYHSLMFYFYAMPFVLGDDGIIYGEAEPLTVGGREFPGIKMAFESGVGDSDLDEYMLYYDPETYQMAWLAYTVTFGKDQKSDKFSFIKYTGWQNVDGLLLPTILQWYKLDDEGIPETMRNEIVFSNISLSENAPDPKMFKKPENGTSASM